MTVAPLKLTPHPLQRCGARAIILLAGKRDPGEVGEEDLLKVIERVTQDAVTAAIADKNSATYDWWKVLFALYPNSPPTHARRSRDREKLLPEIMGLFEPDRQGTILKPCTFCGRECGTVWAKSLMPMFDSVRMLNTLPPKTAGWPLCRSCRLALWALPYGAWVTAGSATVLTCADSSVEQEFCRRNVDRAGKVQQLGFDGLPASAGPEAVTLRALREHAGGPGEAAAVLWTFKNDNQEPWLRTGSTRSGLAIFQRRMLADTAARQGWVALCRALTVRDKKTGQVTTYGRDMVARSLFDREDSDHDSFLGLLAQRTKDIGKVSLPVLHRWQRLSALYLEVLYEMDVSRLDPVVQLLADWMEKESSRGRFNEYCRVARNSYELPKLLMNASARLLLDGRKPADITGISQPLFADGPQGWRLRAQLFFELVAELSRRGVPIGAAEAGEDEIAEIGDSNDEEEAYA